MRLEHLLSGAIPHWGVGFSDISFEGTLTIFLIYRFFYKILNNPKQELGDRLAKKRRKKWSSGGRKQGTVTATEKLPTN